MGASRSSLGENVRGTEVGAEVARANAVVSSLLSVSSARWCWARLEFGLEEYQQTCEIWLAGHSHFDQGNVGKGKNALL